MLILTDSTPQEADTYSNIHHEAKKKPLWDLTAYHLKNQGPGNFLLLLKVWLSEAIWKQPRLSAATHPSCTMSKHSE